MSGLLSLLCLSLPGQMPEPQSPGGDSIFPYVERMGEIPSSAQQEVWKLPDHRRLQCSVLDKPISWQLQAVLDPVFRDKGQTSV